MPSIKVDRDRCKGCELCNAACPQAIIAMSKEINTKGYFFAKVIDHGRCIGCMLCAISCPDLAITVHGTAVQYRLYDYGTGGQITTDTPQAGRGFVTSGR